MSTASRTAPSGALPTSSMQRLIAGARNDLWQRLQSPWLLWLGGTIGLAAAWAARSLPQLPGQLVDEPATAARWMQEASVTYGLWGNLWLALGLFDVLHSPLLHIAIALCIPPFAAQLAAEIAAMRQRTAIHQHLASAPTVAAGEAASLPMTYAVRRRFVVAHPPDHLLSILARTTEAAGYTTATQRLPLQTPSTAPPDRDDLSAPDEEIRVSAQRAPRITALRPLLPLGMLLALGSLWGALVWGWQVAAPPLAPGATYQAIGHSLSLAYTPSLSPTIPSLLGVSFGTYQVDLPIEQPQRRPLGAATLTLDPAFPALWITTADGSAQLSLPGRGESQSSVGLVFTGDTAEESVLLSSLGAGLRVIRRTNPAPGFVLELYRSDEVQPVYRAELPPNGRLLIPLARTNLELIVTTLPGLLVNVRYLPNLWLAWVGLALALIGAAGYTVAAGWWAIQLAPWSQNHTVIVLQGSDPNRVEALAQQLQAPHDPATVAIHADARQSEVGNG